MQILFCGSLSVFVFNVFNNSESRLMEKFLLCHKDLINTCIPYTVFLV